MTRQNGWYWADESNGQIALAGDACTKAASQTAPVLDVAVTCERDAGSDAAIVDADTPD